MKKHWMRFLETSIYHSLDMKTDIHWRKNSITENTQSLPDGCKPLLDYVKGSDVLIERLSQTGVVDKEDGEVVFLNSHMVRELYQKREIYGDGMA